MVQNKEEMRKEIDYQTRMLINLKKWMRNLCILSSIFVAIGYWALKLQDGRVYDIIGVLMIIGIAISVILCIIIGLAHKNGKNNLSKIERLMSQERSLR